jgi:peptide/nickel transport system substrate-binding protein
MKKKIVWVVVSCLMALSLVMASCGPAEEEAEVEVGEEEVEVGEEEIEVGEEEEAEEEGGLLSPETPKYGGTFTFASYEPMGFDPYYTFMVQASTLYICNEELLMGDWTQTPAGTGESGIGGFLGFSSRLTGQLCESWSMPDDETLLFNIRQGVHWWDKPPVNGREYTAEDAAWAINHLWEAPMGAHQMIVAPGERIISATALDKYTLEVKVPPEAQGLQIIYTGSWLYHYPKEVVDTYGDMKDWRNVCGTGAYMLTDYVAGSVLTYQKNPTYWQYDPLHPENRLPYIDTLKGLIITDASTQLAAFRTGQLDYSVGVMLTIENAHMLLEEFPEMDYVTIPSFANHLYFRVDKPELPWDDLRVRQAMTLVVNKQELIDEYYHGEADLQAAIYPPDKAWEPFYTPLEEMPTGPTTSDSKCGVQELFYYTPESVTKAKQLLTEAGYPDGFTCSIISSNPQDTDFLSVIKEYFAQVDVTLNIEQLEGSIVAGMRRSRSYEEGIYTGSPDSSFPYDMHSTRSESFDCFSYYEHPVTRAAYEEERSYVCKDDAKYAATLKAVVPFILEQCVGIWCPIPRSYRLWWPWVQNYHGEWALGCDDQSLALYYIWLDEALKRQMGY